MRASTLSCCFLAALALSASTAAVAGLGSTPSTFAASTAVQARRVAAAPAGAGSAASTAYTVQETTLEGGTLVREYVDGRGQVFAVSWNGPFLPDLRTLLGNHFDALTARGQRGRGRGPVRVNQQDLVIESGGHMRAWHGRAWLNSELPAGVGAEVVE